MLRRATTVSARRGALLLCRPPDHNQPEPYRWRDLTYDEDLARNPYDGEAETQSMHGSLLPEYYDAWWGVGPYEELIMDMHPEWISTKWFAGMWVYCLLFFISLNIWVNAYVWELPYPSGPVFAPDHSQYIARGGDPKNPVYLRQLEQEKKNAEMYGKTPAPQFYHQ